MNAQSTWVLALVALSVIGVALAEGEAAAAVPTDRCVLLILRGEAEKALEECKSIVTKPESLDQIVKDTYSGCPANFDRLFVFLNLLKRTEQINGFITLIGEIKTNNQTSNPNILKLGYKIRHIEKCVEGEQLEAFNKSKSALPVEVSQLFWEDFCVVTHHYLPYEYIYPLENADSLTKEGYKRIFTWMKGDGRTSTVGHWLLRSFIDEEDNLVKFTLKNKYYDGHYLAQTTDAAHRLDYDRRLVLGLIGVPNAKKEWEIVPAFDHCARCYRVRNVDFGAPEYLYAPADAVYDENRRSTLTGSLAVAVPKSDVWEIHCASGKAEINLAQKPLNPV